MKCGADSQHGVILIEAMVGILIFSIGILALLGLQAAAIGSTTEAKFRSDAAFLANQVITRMWTDKANVLSYDTSGSYGPLTTWKSEVAYALPGATGTNAPTIAVSGTELTGFDISVTVRWQKPGDPAPHNFLALARIDFQ